MFKKSGNRFSIQFNPEDKHQAFAASVLNSMGRTKAEYIAELIFWDQAFPNEQTAAKKAGTAPAEDKHETRAERLQASPEAPALMLKEPEDDTDEWHDESDPPIGESSPESIAQRGLEAFGIKF